MKKSDKAQTKPVARKKQAPLADKPKPISITDCTEEEKGLSFVIGLGTDADEQHGRQKWSPPMVPAQDASNKVDTKSKQK